MTNYNIDYLEIGTNHYQPLVINSKFWKTLDKKFLHQGNERLSTDRLKIIQNELENAISGETFFDIGCNIGLFCHFLNISKKLNTIGIDNNVHVNVKKFTTFSSIEIAKKLNYIYNSNAKFIDGNYIDYINTSYDYINYLSVWHHHFVGYGNKKSEQKMTQNKCFEILENICINVNKKMFFEYDLKISQVSSEKILDFLQRFGSVKQYSIIESSTVTNYNFDRKLYVLDKTN